MPKQKIVVILGQTATGKSDLAVRLARKFGGEVISADSRQVYRGLNLGTGKITKKEMRGVRHHLLDVVSPRRQFSVAEYQRLARGAMADIARRGKIPIICGGTGLYIDAVVNGKTFPEVPPNKKLRKQLGRKTVKQLFEMLKKLDPRRAKNIDAKNPRRLIRAIEIARALGNVPFLGAKPPKFSILKIGLKLPDDELKHKIHARLLSRVRKGMVPEARKLHARGLSWRKMEALGLEYKYLSKYLNNKITKQEMLAKLQTEIWRYAKRQMTWFKRDKNIKWFKPEETRKIMGLVKKFLN